MTKPRMVAVTCLVLLFTCLPVAAADGPPDGQLLILLANDDGYDAPGLRALGEALAGLGQVFVAAPMENQSGTGHSTTTREFIAVRPVEIAPGVKGFAIAAKPATCVRLALESLVPRPPDLVVSGINRGRNLGVVTFYSGTVGAAREAAFVGIPAIAVSNATNDAGDYASTAAFVRKLVEQLRAEGRLRPGLYLNVNGPAGAPRGVRITRQSTTPAPEFFTKYTNPRNDNFFWSDYENLKGDAEGTDVWAVLNGFISVTPMQYDQTRTADLEWLQKLKLEEAATLAR